MKPKKTHKVIHGITQNLNNKKKVKDIVKDPEPG